MRWSGTLVHADFGPGQWMLRTDDGKSFPLHGAVPAGLRGRRVTVRGRAVQAFGFAMTGSDTAIEVRSVHAG